MAVCYLAAAGSVSLGSEVCGIAGGPLLWWVWLAGISEPPALFPGWCVLLVLAQSLASGRGPGRWVQSQGRGSGSSPLSSTAVNFVPAEAR